MLLIYGCLLEGQILHISDVQVVETKLIGDSPVIIVRVGIFKYFLNCKCCTEADSLVVTAVFHKLVAVPNTANLLCAR